MKFKIIFIHGTKILTALFYWFQIKFVNCLFFLIREKHSQLARALMLVNHLLHGLKTFSVGKGFDACKPCSKCQKGEVVKETCIRRRDTKCTPEKDFNNSKQKPFLPVPTKSKPRTNGDTRIAKEEPSKSSSGSESFSTLSSKSLFINFFWI